MNYHCYEIVLRAKYFYTNLEGCEVLTGRICCIGQNVLKYYFQTGSSSSTSHFHIFFLIAFLEDALIRNIIVILCNNYMIII